MSVERVIEVGNVKLGEGPHWDMATRSLYYVDIDNTSIHRYTPSTKEHVSAKIENAKTVSLIIPTANNKIGEPMKFVITFDRCVKQIEWDGISSTVNILSTITEVDTESGVCGNRINDGKCDPTGRLWFGTMGPEEIEGDFSPDMGTLFNLEANNTSKPHVSKLGIANGLAWSHDLTKMYYIDSLKGTVDQFDIDIASATLTNRKSIFTLANHGVDGFPDGMAIDVDGNLWFAVYNGGCVVKIDPRKPETLLQVVKLPAVQVTSLAFGGDNLDELYVTTAMRAYKEKLEPPHHGALYRITGLGVTGLPGVNAKLH